MSSRKRKENYLLIITKLFQSHYSHPGTWREHSMNPPTVKKEDLHHFVMPHKYRALRELFFFFFFRLRGIIYLISKLRKI